MQITTAPTVAAKRPACLPGHSDPADQEAKRDQHEALPIQSARWSDRDRNIASRGSFECLRGYGERNSSRVGSDQSARIQHDEGRRAGRSGPDAVGSACCASRRHPETLVRSVISAGHHARLERYRPDRLAERSQGDEMLAKHQRIPVMLETPWHRVRGQVPVLPPPPGGGVLPRRCSDRFRCRPSAPRRGHRSDPGAA